MFAEGFATAKVVCIVENLFENGEWGILEWRDPLGLKGCGFYSSRQRRDRVSARPVEQAAFLSTPPVTMAGVLKRWVPDSSARKEITYERSHTAPPCSFL